VQVDRCCRVCEARKFVVVKGSKKCEDDGNIDKNTPRNFRVGIQ